MNLKHFSLTCFSFMSISSFATDMIYLSADGSRDSVSLHDIRSVKVNSPYDTDASFTLNLFDGTKIPDLKTLYLNKLGESDSLLTKVESVEVEGFHAISIYPNPVSEKIFLTGIDESVKVEILDVKGHVVKTDRGNVIDVTSLTDGLYILTAAGKYAKFIKRSK